MNPASRLPLFPTISSTQPLVKKWLREHAAIRVTQPLSRKTRPGKIAATSDTPLVNVRKKREELWDFLTKSRQIGFVPPPSHCSALLFGSLSLSLSCRPQ